jgi:Flp pilus assembly pilin Flp
MKLVSFFKEEEGMGTAEVVIIAAVLVAVALVFRDRIHNFVNGIMDKSLNINDIDAAKPSRT